MPARDRYHEPFVRALEKDGWKVTHDPLAIKVGEMDLFIRPVAWVLCGEGAWQAKPVQQKPSPFGPAPARRTDKGLFLAVHEPIYSESSARTWAA